MQITITPSSGHFDKYLDIYFKIKFDTFIENGKLTFLNTSMNDQSIEILGSNTSIIHNGIELLVNKTDTVDGFLNLFPNDASTFNLQQLNTVEIKISLNCPDTSIVDNISFFNESISIDSNILPFDLQIINKTIDIEKHEPLKISIISQVQNKYEFVIMSECKTKQYVFDVLCHPGQNDIEIPASVLFEELQLDKFGFSSFIMSWIKFQGKDFKGFLLRKNIHIPFVKIKFNGTVNFRPLPSVFTDLKGDPFSNSFILSDRYLVPVHKEFSAFGKNKTFDNRYLFFMMLYRHENQDIRDEIHKITLEKRTTSNKIIETATILNSINNENIHYHVPSNAKMSMAGDFKYLYVKPVSQQKSNQASAVINSPVKSKGCGCGRKNAKQ